MQKVLQKLHQNSRYARFFCAISRLRHDIDVNMLLFVQKSNIGWYKTSHSSDFDAEKLFFCANATSKLTLGIYERHFFCRY